jgi:toxin secretion/phage lysis holin
VIEDFKRLFLDNGEIKAVITAITIFISWSFDGQRQALYAISVVLVIDFLTGTHYALRSGNWNSRRSLSGVSKFFRYLVYMLVARMIDKVVPIPFASPLMDTYIIITEAGSILENFAKMGYPVPTTLLNKLKTFYEKKS